ncbi:hypothetical protein [Marmoricola sp. URHA0025 HA25]
MPGSGTEGKTGTQPSEWRTEPLALRAWSWPHTGLAYATPSMWSPGCGVAETGKAELRVAPESQPVTKLGVSGQTPCGAAAHWTR